MSCRRAGVEERPGAWDMAPAAGPRAQGPRVLPTGLESGPKEDEGQRKAGRGPQPRLFWLG